MNIAKNEYFFSYNTETFVQRMAIKQNAGMNIFTRKLGDALRLVGGRAAFQNVLLNFVTNVKCPDNKQPIQAYIEGQRLSITTFKAHSATPRLFLFVKKCIVGHKNIKVNLISQHALSLRRKSIVCCFYLIKTMETFGGRSRTPIPSKMQMFVVEVMTNAPDNSCYQSLGVSMLINYQHSPTLKVFLPVIFRKVFLSKWGKRTRKM